MLRSLLTGVSGAKAHQKRLDVVGNNIANVNTVGFKKSTVVFQDLLSQTERGAMAPDGNVGGVNAKQVGLGVQVGAIETIHTQGTVSQTGNRTDMAIQGEGYYVVKNGAENLYTRAGQFVLDSNSDLAMSGTGYRVQGNEMTVDENGVASTGSELSDINIPIGRKMEAKATSTVGYRCNLDSRVDPYLPLGIPDGVKFSSEILGSEYTISVAEGEDVSDFINIRLENEADGSVDTLRFSFEGVEQSSHDESTYYPKLELVGSSDHTVNYDAAKGELSIDGTSIPMSAYMNYQAVTLDDSTGTSHTYLAEVTEIGNKAQVRLWGQGQDESTGADQMDYFQWNVLKTEDGLFDPDSTLKMTTGKDSEFPDQISLFLGVDSSGKALNFRGNVSPIIGPATSNSVVNKYGDTGTPLISAYQVSNGTAFSDITYRAQENMPPDPTEFITITLDFSKGGTSAVAAGTRTIQLEFKGVSEDGNVILQPNPSSVTLPVAGNTNDLKLKSHKVVYDPEKGTLSLVNEDTGKTTWNYSDFNFQTTEINGARYLVDYSQLTHGDPGTGVYGDKVTFWGPNEMGIMTAFDMDLSATSGDVEFDGTEYSLASGSSGQELGKLAGGVTVTAKPSPTDPSKLIFTYDGTDGGDPVSSIREGSGSVHEGKGTIYDSLGNEHTLEVVWKKVGSNAWSWEAFLPDEPELKLSDNKGVLRFSSEGKLLSGGENTISIGFSAIGADDADVVLDFSGKSFDKEEIEGVTQYGSAFTTKPYTQNGYSMGILEDFSVSNDGTIVGIYDNGQNRGLYKMALAMFANPQGLVKTGNTCFSKSINSGDPSIVNAMVEGAGTIAGSSLEYSNVDITDEFTDLITTQRGFQASARVITTSDSVLEELLNLKR